MNLLEIAALAKLKLLEHGLNDWTFNWHQRKTQYGTCSYSRKTIYLSSFYVGRAPDESIIDTILHEIAHALVGAGHHHNQIWKKKCIEIGAAPQRCSKNFELVDDYKHAYKCPKCGEVWKTHRRLRNHTARWHKKCGRNAYIVKIK